VVDASEFTVERRGVVEIWAEVIQEEVMRRCGCHRASPGAHGIMSSVDKNCW
jgi:hypothetical protein